MASQVTPTKFVIKLDGNHDRDDQDTSSGCSATDSDVTPSSSTDSMLVENCNNCEQKPKKSASEGTVSQHDTEQTPVASGPQKSSSATAKLGTTTITATACQLGEKNPANMNLAGYLLIQLANDSKDKLEDILHKGNVSSIGFTIPVGSNLDEQLNNICNAKANSETEKLQSDSGISLNSATSSVSESHVSKATSDITAGMQKLSTNANMADDYDVMLKPSWRIQSSHSIMDVIPASPDIDRFSKKVFIGGTWDFDHKQIIASFRRFGPLTIEAPYFPAKGFCFLVFQSEKSVESLVKACYIENGKFFLRLLMRIFPDRKVQQVEFVQVEVRPWKQRWATYVSPGTEYVDPRKTVGLVGLPKLLKATELSTIMDRQFGGVVYAAVDTDKETGYPVGIGRVAFFSQKSYRASLAAGYFDLQQRGSGSCNRVKVVPGSFLSNRYSMGGLSMIDRGAHITEKWNATVPNPQNERFSFVAPSTGVAYATAQGERFTTTNFNQDSVY